MSKRITTIILLMCSLVFSCLAQDDDMVKKLKIAYMERFARFINWPDSLEFNQEDGNFVFGLIGNTDLSEELEEFFLTHQIKKVPVRLVHFSDIEDLDACNLLFISESEKKNLNNILEMTTGKPILTISDTEGFCEAGVLINFFIEDELLKFEINKDAAQESGLSVSFMLFKKAKLINGD